MKLVSLESWEKEFEYDYYMYIPLTILLNSIVGSLAAMEILTHGTTFLTGLQLTICVALCMGYNGALYASINRKVIFWWLIISLVVNALFFFINLF